MPVSKLCPNPLGCRVYCAVLTGTQREVVHWISFTMFLLQAGEYFCSLLQIYQPISPMALDLSSVIELIKL